MNKKALFLFRRDLRLEDNLGLIQSLIDSDTVIPCFIYDTNLIENPDIENFRWSFLNQCLTDLDGQLKSKNSALQIFTGSPEKIIEEIILHHQIDSVFYNIDFSRYSENRDKKIFKICNRYGIKFSGYLDFLLHNPNEIKTNEGKPYLIYSHFIKKAKQHPVRNILKNVYDNYHKKSISDEKIKEPANSESTIIGGRSEGLKILKNLRDFQSYLEDRDFPSRPTTNISPHNKFGTISIRETYRSIQNELGNHHALINQIYWREFFHYILFHFPESRNIPFKKKYRKIPWSKNIGKFNSWKNGQTGFPIVDAGMRELNSTGFMHNRLRMITASFLTKDLHIDWKMGERYFSKKLIDYDPAVNIGNWQWAASIGCDAVPYFRIFNPWRQQEKFDQQCIYIKKWIPELCELSPHQIHNLWKARSPRLKYPLPIVDHHLESVKAKEIFKNMVD